MNNKLVEKQVKEKLEDQHGLLSFKRLPSTTIPMYKSVEVDDKKGANIEKRSHHLLKLKAVRKHFSLGKQLLYGYCKKAKEFLQTDYLE